MHKEKGAVRAWPWVSDTEKGAPAGNGVLMRAGVVEARRQAEPLCSKLST